MGTRGAVGFRSNKQDKVYYNHMDSYPSYLGNEVLEFISNSSIAELKEIATRIVLVQEDKKPTEEQITECKKWANLSVGNQSIEDWYCLLRDAQGNLDAYRQGLNYMIDSSSFLLDSLFCEYAYIINTDEGILEFYCGFNTKKSNRRGRYASLTDPYATRDSGYYGVALVAKFSLEDIIGVPADKIAKMVAQMEIKKKSYRKSLEKVVDLVAA